MRVAVRWELLSDVDALHDHFQRELGFPEYYSKNWDAWIDCMRYVDDPSAGMVTSPLERGGLLLFELEGVPDEPLDQQSETLNALVGCIATVNAEWKRDGHGTRLGILFVAA